MADIENSPSDREEMRMLFHEAYSKWKSDKEENRLSVKNDTVYEKIIETFRKKACGKQLTTKEYNWLARFECVWQNNKEVLQHKGKIVVKESSLFNLLYDVHLNLGHSGRDGMLHELKKDFDGISKDIVILFVKCCQKCELKKGKVKRGVVVKPILSEDQNSRCQVDLIDYQAKPDGEFRFIMVYQDHLTKFVILRPLKRKTGEAVAEQLIEIFSIFDAPQVLQSDNGKEFVNSVIKSLVLQWPQCKNIQGKPRHSQSQGSVERANRDIGDILQTMMADENTSQWASLLPRVQLTKNSRFHSGIKLSPFEAMFGRKVSQIGHNHSDDVDDDAEASGSNEVDGAGTPDDTESAEDAGGSSSEAVEVEGNEVHAAETEEPRADEATETEEPVEDALHEQQEQIQVNRETARRGQKRQAERMLEMSAKRFKPLEVGQNVRIPVADVDRAKTDARNILGIIMEKKDDFYKVGTKNGRLVQLFARNQLEPTAESFMQINEVPDNEIRSVRTAAAEESVSGGQGHVHCNCKTKCQDKKCKCRREGRLCNSRCHSSLTCTNK